MNNMTGEIYLKTKEKVYIKPHVPINIGDLCEIVGEKKITNSIKSFKIIQGPYDEKIFVVSLLAIIKQIKAQYPNVTISTLNDKDVVIEIDYSDTKQNKVLNALKIFIVCTILFIGAGITIMNFHADVNMSEVHKNVYEFITGNRVERPLWISIPYSFGIGLGMIVFFNNISKKSRESDQPSPLDLEIDSYQNNVDDFIRNKSKEKRK